MTLEVKKVINAFANTVSFILACRHYCFRAVKGKAKFSVLSLLFASSSKSSYKDSVEAACLKVARKDLKGGDH